MTDEEAVAFLRQLVLIPSETGRETEAVGFLVDTFQRSGLEATVDVAGNAVGRTEPNEKRLLFLGHIDTVPGQIEVRVEGGTLYGRGTVDAKGPLAAAAVAAIRCRRVPGLEIVGAVGEEGPSRGARHLVSDPAPDGLVVGEPSGSDSIVLGYKGSMRADITIERRVAHSAGREATTPDVAIDAWLRIRQVCELLSPGEAVFDQLTPALLDIARETDGLTERVRMHAGFRLPPELDIEEARTKIAEAAAPGTAEFREADPAYRAPRTTKLVSSFVRGIRATEMTPRFKVKTGTSDLNVVGPAWQCPAVVYGPGDSSLDHTPNEHLLIDEYLRGIAVLCQVFSDWGRA